MSKMPDTAVCLGCGYSLRGLPSPICPECGRGFEPGSAGTYRDAASPGPLFSLARPPHRWHRRLVLAITAICLFDASSPGFICPDGVTFVYLTIVVLCFSAIGADFLVRLSALGIRCLNRSGKNYGMGACKHRSDWLVTPLCMLVLAMTFYFPWPAWVRFRMSLPAFERAVNSVGDSDELSVIGFFVITRTIRDQNGAVFFETGRGGYFRAGFMYRPNAQPFIRLIPVPPHPVDLMAPGWYIAYRSWS